MKKAGSKMLRSILFFAIACIALLSVLEFWLNGASDPFSEIRLDEPDTYAESICASVQHRFVVSQSPSAKPCLATRDVALYLKSIERRDRTGYAETFGWTCDSGGDLMVAIQVGVNWTGFCIRCRFAVGKTHCSL